MGSAYNSAGRVNGSDLFEPAGELYTQFLKPNGFPGLETSNNL